MKKEKAKEIFVSKIKKYVRENFTGCECWSLTENFDKVLKEEFDLLEKYFKKLFLQEQKIERRCLKNGRRRNKGRTNRRNKRRGRRSRRINFGKDLF